MNPFFSFFKTHRDMAIQRVFWPSIKKVKIYENAQCTILPDSEPLDVPISTAITTRHSSTKFSSKPITLENLGSLLYWSGGEIGHRVVSNNEESYEKVLRPHPSGGACYPIETYICLDQESDHLPRGFYHYRPDIHGLELIYQCESTTLMKDFKKNLSPYGWSYDAPVILLFTFILERSVPKYGGFAYKLGLIEAGHIAQNFYLNSTALDLGCRALGNPNETLAHRYLQLDGYNENFFYALVIGHHSDSENKKGAAG